MKTATAILSTLPQSMKLPRKVANTGINQVERLAEYSDNFQVKYLAQGILYADSTGRTTGSVSLALRKSTPWQIANLIAKMIADGIKVQAEVPAWLNHKALENLS